MSLEIRTNDANSLTFANFSKKNLNPYFGPWIKNVENIYRITKGVLIVENNMVSSMWEPSSHNFLITLAPPRAIRITSNKIINKLLFSSINYIVDIFYYAPILTIKEFTQAFFEEKKECHKLFHENILVLQKNDAQNPQLEHCYKAKQLFSKFMQSRKIRVSINLALLITTISAIAFVIIGSCFVPFLPILQNTLLACATAYTVKSVYKYFNKEEKYLKKLLEITEMIY